MDLLYKEITEKIIKGYFNVYNTLGYGFLEKVYENAMALELHELGLEVKCQYPIAVFYNSKKIGDYFADMLINNRVILELKASKHLMEEHECQLINYLKATNIEVGLLMNFGKEAEYKRKVFMNKFKKLNNSSLCK
ncbi:MAG: GxxExxY protein [Methylococcaceae bacterium]|nr:GxxExxY protein [Prolixibacteraceae bacterium]